MTTSAPIAAGGPLPGETRSLAGYYFLTPVWGASYTKLYVEVVIPAQLATGNLEAFRHHPGCRYIIYTTRADADFIRSSPVFAKLNACVPVTFEWLDQSAGTTHDKMSACYRSGIALAGRADAGVLFLTPDIVFADGSFAAIKRLAEGGRDAVFVPAIRTLKQGVVAALQRSRGGDDVIRVQPRDLMQIALDNLHPLADASWWDQGDTGLLPANLYWSVGKEGILGHCFHLHPVFVHPQRKDAKFFGTVDDDFVAAACPDARRDYVVSDSDEFLSIELSDLAHFFDTGFRKGSVEDAAKWAEQFASTRHRMLFDHVVRMHTGMRDPDAWRKTEAEAGRVVAAIKAKLEVPWWSLLTSGSQAWIRRLLRWNLDRRLVAENETSGALGRLPYKFSFWVVGVYLFIIREIPKHRRWYFGTLDHPRFFTTSHLIRGLLKDDLLQMAGSAPALVLISDDPSESIVGSILGEAKVKLSIARPVMHDGESSLVSRDLGRPILPESCGFVVIEPGRSDNLKDVLAAAHHALRPNGRLLLVSGRVDFGFARKDAPPGDRATAEALLAPGFRLIDHRQQGGPGSVGFNDFNRWLNDKARRSPVIARIVEFALPFIWVPVLIVMNSVARGIAVVRDGLERTPSSWMTSLSLAEKVDRAKAPSAPAAEQAAAG